MRITPSIAAVLLFASPLWAQETPAKGKIVAVDLFKNGLAVVKYEVTLGKSGTYILNDAPNPVHGTFWIESAVPVEAAMKMRDVEVPATEALPGNFQEDLAGKQVTLHFKGQNRPPVTGVMMKLKQEKSDEPPAVRYLREERPAPKYLVLQTTKSRIFVEAADVLSVEAEDVGDKVIRRKPRLLLTLGKTDKAETKVALRYITHGITWAPSYRIDISDPKSLSLEQHATVKNELKDLEGAEIRLISGYPSVQYSYVSSLLNPETNINRFLSELNNGRNRGNNFNDNGVVSQQTSIGNSYLPGPAGVTGAVPTGEGVDVHYQPIGKRTLAEGESLALTVSQGKANYERIVEWFVTDNRDESNSRDRGDDESAWDALKFKNPLTFPMTTGPATVTANGSFNGQRTSYWVNAGEETMLRVEKALSVRTLSTENERIGKDDGGREHTWIGGRQYRKATVDGELTVNNHRKETISMVIRRRFSGELLKAEGDPKASLSAEGVVSVNKRNELLWSLPLKAGEEKKLKYSYTVLVPH
jgi:hypothetical protein